MGQGRLEFVPEAPAGEAGGMGDHGLPVPGPVQGGVGQGVGLMNHETTVRAVMQEFQEDFLEAFERLNGYMEN